MKLSEKINEMIRKGIDEDTIKDELDDDDSGVKSNPYVDFEIGANFAWTSVLNILNICNVDVELDKGGK